MQREVRKKKIPAKFRNGSFALESEHSPDPPRRNNKKTAVIPFEPRSIADRRVEKVVQNPLLNWTPLDLNSPASVANNTQLSEEEEEEQDIARANLSAEPQGEISLPKKRGLETNWVKDLITQNGNVYSCNHCVKTWTRKEGIKFQSGNLKIHFMRKHKQILKGLGIVKMEENEEVNYDSAKLNRDIVRWICASCLPLSTVDNKFFRKIIERLGGTCVGRRQLVRRFVPQVLDECKEEIVGALAGKDFFYSITSDGWTTPNNKKLHCTIHWINSKGDLQKRVLDIGDLGDSATAEVIGSLWKHQIKQWDLEPNNLVACVVDGGSNFQAASRRQTVNVYCHCHRLHLIAMEILHHEDVYGLYKKCKRVVKYVNKSYQTCQRLEAALNQPGATRWSSAERMFTSFLQNIEPIGEIAKEIDCPISHPEWDLIERLSQLLGYLSIVLTKLESDEVPTSNLFLPALVTLQKKRIAISDSFDSIIELATSALEARIPFNEFDVSNKLMLLAAWCDPRFSTFTFLDTTDDVRLKYANFCKQCAKEWLRGQLPMATTKKVINSSISCLQQLPVMRWTSTVLFILKIHPHSI